MTAKADTEAGRRRLEVFEDEAGGWAVRRAGEAEALTQHDTREQAEKAARLHSTEGVGVDMRQDIFTNDPEQAVRPRRALAVAAIGLALAILILVVGSIVVLAA